MNGNQHLKHSIALSVLIAGILSAIGSPAISDTVSFKDEGAAFNELRKSPIDKSGVYKKGEYLFAAAIRPYNIQTRSKDEIWAKHNIGKILSNYCADRLEANFTDNDKKIIKLRPASLQLPGKLMLNGKWNNSYAYVLAIKQADFDRSCKLPYLQNQISTVKRNVRVQPDSYLDIVEILGAAEVSALSKAKKNQFPTLALDSALDETNKSNKMAEMTQFNGNLLESLHERVKNLGIEILDVKFATPTLKKIALAQGYVKVRSDSTNKAVEHLNIVKRFFSEGKNLDAAILLLEAAAEINPSEPEIWEYLEAAYRSKREVQKGHLACRVWYLTSTDSSEPLKKLLNYLPKSEFTQIFLS